MLNKKIKHSLIKFVSDFLGVRVHNYPYVLITNFYLF
jgi:hypothetical protein